MQFLGQIHPKKNKEKYYSVEIVELGIHTQGKSFKECLEMAKDALETILEIDITVHPIDKFSFTVTANDLRPLVGRFLETMRLNSGLSIREVVRRLGRSSPNYYSQYELGKSLPGLDTLTSIVKVMTNKNDFVLTLR